MNQREKKLLIGFVGVVVLAVGMSLYKSTIRPLFEGNAGLEEAADRLADRSEELESLETRLHDQYRALVLRNGGMDPSRWRDDWYERLDTLLRSVKLGSGRITPKPVAINQKTKVATLKISVSAKGTFAQCVDFIRGFYKIPMVARLASLRLVPTASAHRADHDEVTLDAEIEAMLLPPSKAWGEPSGKQPEEVDRMAAADISMLRSWRPFNPYIPPPTPTPTPTPGPVVSPTPSPTPSPPPVDRPDEWPDADELIIKMVSGYGSGDYWVREVLLENVMDFSTRYVAAGEDLDGGELVLVNALGAVVHKQSDNHDFGYWVYPLGELLNARLRLEDSAVQWPEIYVAARQYLRDRGEIPPEPQAQAPADPADVWAKVDLTTEAKDRLLRKTAEALTGPAENDEMGPPLPPDFSPQENTTDENPSAAAEDAATNGPHSPQRAEHPTVQGAGSQRERPDRTHPGADAASAPATPQPSHATRPGARPAAQPRRPARGPRQPAPRPTHNPNEEADDVAPPE
ncbi:MAG TPA: hypothetical protein P5572_08800 [Phycisphaerae bacterium]|nr:hypothetical protein [Phycisphaerae bacterium]